MKQRFQPGGELDLLTESELKKTLIEVMAGSTIEPAIVRTEGDAKADTAGNVTIEVYRTPAGMGFFLTRLLVRLDGASFAVPFTGAGAMMELLRNDAVVDGRSLVAAAITPAGLPQMLTWGEDSAPWYANGDLLAVRLTAVTANAVASVRIAGKQSPVVFGN